jgi:hypothetical protein
MKHRFALPVALILTIGAAQNINGPSTPPTHAEAPPTTANPSTTTTLPPQPTAPPTHTKPPKTKTTTTTPPNPHLQTLTATYAWGSKNKDQTKSLQALLNIPTDGVYERQTRAAHHQALQFLGLDTSRLPHPPSGQTRRFPDSSRCPQIEAIALSVGWPEQEIRTLSYVAYRESRCDPNAYNGRNRDRSYGLVQINTKGSLWDHRRDLCGLNQKEDLFIPAVNLSCAYELWARSGWAPWNM